MIHIVDPPFEVDARNKDSVKPVAEHIFNITKDVLEGIELYDICRQVKKNLLNYSKSTNEQIITWEEFNKICNNDDKAKLNAIAMSLNESGHHLRKWIQTHRSRSQLVLQSDYREPHWFPKIRSIKRYHWI